MQRSLIFILSIIFSIALCNQIKAEVEGNCVNCHTIHNSQHKSDMAVYGGTSGANPCLTRGDCVGCHAYGAGSGTNNVENIGGSDVPQVWHEGTDLAAGNFRYIASNSNDRKGHNVADINQEGNVSMFPLPGCKTDPGITAANFSCAGKYGCHGDRTVTGETTSMKGAHHADDSTIDGSTTGKSYRFLKGVLGLENTKSAWQNVDANDHNEYKGLTSPDDSASDTNPGIGGSISGFCAECHGYYHGDALDETGGSFSPWIRHPTDISLPSSGEYTNYTTYSIVAPVARAVLPESPSDIVTPGGKTDDILMCLSCHGAHATNYYKLMRWDSASLSLSTALEGCAVCHTSKN